MGLRLRVGRDAAVALHRAGVGRWSWGQARLALSTVDGREQWVAGPAETIVALEAATRRVLDEPGRCTLSPPSPVCGWAGRLAAILRPNRETRHSAVLASDARRRLPFRRSGDRTRRNGRVRLFDGRETEGYVLGMPLLRTLTGTSSGGEAVFVLSGLTFAAFVAYVAVRVGIRGSGRCSTTRSGTASHEPIWRRPSGPDTGTR